MTLSTPGTSRTAETVAPILIVEDQEDIRKLIRMTVELTGRGIVESADGESGWRAACAVQPAVILLDVMMPGPANGLEICARIKKDPQMAGTPVVLLTARGQQADIDAGLAAGADAYLVKPFSPLELLDLVEGYLARGAAVTH